jgi:PTH1 family peptidyl-tRNA hydrolase
MWIIVGLGNPGAEYAQTRHNIGFMVVATVARRWDIALRDQGPALRVGHGHVAGRPAWLAQPQTFMNLSGEALACLERAADDAMVVVYDDLDLPAGRIRVRRRGGSDFARVRVGIGRPPVGCDVAEYVLAPLSQADLGAVRAGVERASDAVECIIADGVDAAMNRFNTRTLPDTER